MRAGRFTGRAAGWDGYSLNTNVQLSSITISPLLHVCLFLLFQYPPQLTLSSQQFLSSFLSHFAACLLYLFMSSPQFFPVPASSRLSIHSASALIFISDTPSHASHQTLLRLPEICLFASHFSNLPTQAHMQTSLTKAANYSQVSTPVPLKDQAD